MKPIKFPEADRTFAKDQPQYNPLPAYKHPSVQGEVITCWKLSTRERWKLMFSGKLWLCLCTFNQPLQPVLLSVDKEDVLSIKSPSYLSKLMKKNFVLNGDHSFRMWFKIMWSNFYIQLFILALAFLIGIITQYDTFDVMWGFILCLAIPSLTMLAIAYKGFYQFWNDLKNGESR